ncbi:DUF3565 domain-containing protein [Pseudomonas sp. RL]|uniref:DUF3565 domain-containing protein n=1 Tax=Pseudomonas sp. RL TaxID=1452718 RepID=UPI00210E2A63|nr:DUF3565 domain-containing protein [Pseudomonas sp. RL]
MQVDQRRAASGAVDHLAGIVGEGIVDGDSLVGGDLHGEDLLVESLERGSLPARAVESEPCADRRVAPALLGFRQDDEGHWVALLSCGHTQHLRHSPPWQSRAWVLDADSRARRIGQPFDCGWCRQAGPAERVPDARAQRSGDQLR